MATAKLTKLELKIMEALWTQGPSAVREAERLLKDLEEKAKGK